MIVSQVLMMEDIIHGNRDLLTDLLEEFQVHVAIGLVLYTRKSHGSQASYSRGQRNEAKRIHAVLLHMPNDLGPTTFFGKIHYEDRLLRLPHQSGGTLFDRAFMATHEIGRDIRLDTMQSHGIPRRIVQRQGNEIDMHHSGKALGKILAKRVEIAVDGDRLRNLQQSLVPLRESLTGRCGIAVHTGSVWRIKQSRLKRGEGWGLMIFCARATRGLRRPSLDVRSGRSISPHP
jgi:hypothetical protein